jgi:protein-tyrosine phosphatase
MIRGFLSPFRQLNRLGQALHNLPARIRHRSRHAAVRRKLAQIGRPQTLLVVCAGNVCRSPYLEAVLKRDLPNVRVASAGFVGFDRPVPRHALAVSAKRGIDLSAFRSNTLLPHRARTADLVIVMEEEQARYLMAYAGVQRGRIIIAGDLDPTTAPTRSIEDPWNKSINVFESTFNRLDRCGATLTHLLMQNAGNPMAVPPTHSISHFIPAHPVGSAD